LATESGIHMSSQLDLARAPRTPHRARQDRWDLDQPESLALNSVETEPRTVPLDAAGLLAGVQVPAVSEDAPARLPRPILWLAFAGWVVCCGMLFISLVEREPSGGRDGASAAEPLLVATVSAALETVFGDSNRPASGGRRPNVDPSSNYWD
jgi:hypothetical protein